MRAIIVMGLCALAALTALAACVGLSDDADLSGLMSGAEPNCARQCTVTYSSCVSAPAVGTPTVLFYQCKEALKLCAKTCPPKP